MAQGTEVVRLHSAVPECEATVVYEEAGQLSLDTGGLRLGHHTLGPAQYCLEDVVTEAGELRLVARVCALAEAAEDSELRAVISTKLTPALLIISEVFLLLTFVLHAIVPEFRKQMFGGCLEVTRQHCHTGDNRVQSRKLQVLISGYNAAVRCHSSTSNNV